MDPMQHSSLIDLVLERAQQPEKVAYTFLVNGETPGQSLTFGDVDCRSREVAVLLQQAADAGDRVLLLYPPGLDFIPAFFGCLYAGVVAVPTYPPNALRPAQSLQRLQSIVREAGIRGVLCTESVAARLPALFHDVPMLADLPVWATDRPKVADPHAWQRPELTRDRLAFLQYTSGSTAAPKGVMVSHGNLLHNLHAIRTGACIEPSSVGVSWLPVHHDMGLLGGILQPLFVGFPSYLMAPVSFIQRPLRWLQAITRFRATLSGGPNFAYDLCTQKVLADDVAGLDLSSWRIAYNGAEPIRTESLVRFCKTFAPSGFGGDAFHPVYGLAESTLLVAGDRLRVGADIKRVSCGRPAAGTKILIVDPGSRQHLPEGTVGEIWVQSPSVAKGYWNRPDETVHTFHARLADDDDGPYLRSGDLGYLQAGELFVTGRIKDVIIIRGRKHYPQDLEQTVEACHPAFKQHGVAAVTIATPAGERLGIVAEVNPRMRSQVSEMDEAMSVIRQAISLEHELQTHAIALVPMGGIPRTTSGKIQRHKCGEALLEGTLPAIAHWPLPHDSNPTTPRKGRMKPHATSSARAPATNG